MAIDLSQITAAISDGQVATIAVCLAFSVAVWAVKSIKLVRDDQDFPPDEFTDFYSQCGACDEEFPSTQWDENNGVCPSCGYDHEAAESEIPY